MGSSIHWSSTRKLESSLKSETYATFDHIICSVKTHFIQEKEPCQIGSRRILYISLLALYSSLHQVNYWTLQCAKSPVGLNKHQASGHWGGGSHVEKKNMHTHTSLYYQKTLYAVGTEYAHYIPTCYLTVVVRMLSPGFGLRCVCVHAMHFLTGPSISLSALVNEVVEKFNSARVSDLFPLKTSLESNARKSLEHRQRHKAVLYGNRGCRVEKRTYTSLIKIQLRHRWATTCA